MDDIMDIIPQYSYFIYYFHQEYIIEYPAKSHHSNEGENGLHARIWRMPAAVS
jgi:hypothetical protein